MSGNGKAEHDEIMRPAALDLDHAERPSRGNEGGLLGGDEIVVRRRVVAELAGDLLLEPAGDKRDVGRDAGQDAAQRHGAAGGRYADVGDDPRKVVGDLLAQGQYFLRRRDVAVAGSRCSTSGSRWATGAAAAIGRA